jgi:hypothetical protein
MAFERLRAKEIERERRREEYERLRLRERTVFGSAYMRSG